MQAYREAFATGASRLVLSPDDDFLQLLHQAPTPAGRSPRR